MSTDDTDARAREPLCNFCGERSREPAPSGDGLACFPCRYSRESETDAQLDARAREIAAGLDADDRSTVRALACVGPYCFVGWDDDMHAHLRRAGLCTRHEHWANPTELCLAVDRVLAEGTVGK